MGPPLRGVDLRLVDDDGASVDPSDEETIGEIEVRGPNLFLGYLNRDEAAAMREHPEVQAAAVLGEPYSDLGERVVAWVTVDVGRTVSELDLIDHVAAQLGPHKRPRSVHFLEKLPRNELGNVQKQRLRGS